MVGGAFSADEGKASPLLAGAAFAAAARHRGAILLPFTPLTAAAPEPRGYTVSGHRTAASTPARW